MSRTTPTPIRDLGHDPVELLDRSALPLDETHRSLLDLRRLHRWLLGHGPLLRVLRSRLLAGPRRQRLLDLGTGTGDGPADLAASASRRGVALAVFGVDRKLSHLVLGRRLGVPQLRVVASATELPFRDSAFDWTVASLLFHHFEPSGKRRLLAEMRRTSRLGAVIVDLRRSPWTWWLIRLILPVLGTSAVTRHDGLLSAERASTVPEIAELTSAEPVVELRHRFPCRYSLVVRGGSIDGPVWQSSAGTN